MNDNNIIQLSSLFDTNIKNDYDDLEMIEIDDEPPKEKEEIIKLDDIVNQEIPLQEPIKKVDYDKIIEKIQIGLIIFLIIAGTLIYLFGYSFFEPYIKID